jgi:hypothetical protein
MQYSALLLFGLVFLACADYDPHRFKDFLLQNRMKQCEGNAYVAAETFAHFLATNLVSRSPTTPQMATTMGSLSIKGVFLCAHAHAFRIPPGGGAKAPERVPSCNNQMIQPAQLDAYTFETERFITTIGLNIYDGATWAMALAVLGEQDTVSFFYFEPKKFDVFRLPPSTPYSYSSRQGNFKQESSWAEPLVSLRMFEVMPRARVLSSRASVPIPTSPESVDSATERALRSHLLTLGASVEFPIIGL